MSLIALISPRDNKAAILSEDGSRASFAAPHRSGQSSSANYVVRHPDSIAIEISDSSECESQLLILQEQSRSLDFFLFLLDDSLSVELRKEIAGELSLLIRNDSNRDYVLDIVLSSPIPAGTDIEAAITTISDEPKVVGMLRDVLAAQERTKFFQSAWLHMREDPLVQQSGFEKLFGNLIRLGIVRRLVLDGTSQAIVSELAPRLMFEKEVQQYCDARILIKLAQLYSENLPVGKAEPRPVSSHAFAEELGREDSTSFVSSFKPNADMELARVESQVERIVEFFANGRDSQGNQFLNELISQQSTIGGDQSLAVKTLCNVASRCRIAGRVDVASESLTRALSFEKGADTILYLQIGNLFRQMEKFDEALNCYQKAKELDSGEKLDSINREIIRVTVDRGRYDEALTAYLELPDIETSPQSRSSLGTLYRRMGRLGNARHAYEDSVAIDQRYHPALAGLAETNKQFGRHRKAILRYERIFRNFDDLEESSEKTYKLALSFLYRLNKQHDDSRELLVGLYEQYPKDAALNLQLAKHYRLIGEADKSRFHFGESQGIELDPILAMLYQAATRDAGLNLLKKPVARELVLPEWKGLAACSSAIVALQTNHCEQAIAELQNATFVDKFHLAFAEVLNFHATMKMTPTANPKASQLLNRIRKRGYTELQRAVEAIDKREFESALVFERRMCLLVA